MENRLSFQLLASARMLLESRQDIVCRVKEYGLINTHRADVLLKFGDAEIVDSLANSE